MSKQVYVKEATECSIIPLSVLRHIETKQLYCNENHLAGFYMTQALIESNFRTNSKHISTYII